MLELSPDCVVVLSEKVSGSTPLRTKAIIDESVAAPFPLVPATFVSVVAPCFLYQIARDGLAAAAPICEDSNVYPSVEIVPIAFISAGEPIIATV